MGRLAAISKLHAFPRPEQHLTRTTVSGGIVTLLGVATIAVLFAHELSFYLTPARVYHMAVDETTKGKLLPIVLDITFPAVPCEVLALDVLDMSGKHDVDITTNIHKTHIDADGREIKSHRLDDIKEHKSSNEHSDGAMVKVGPGGIVFAHDIAAFEHTVAEIKSQLSGKEGCRISGHLTVERVAGHFRISAYKQNFFVTQQVFPTAEHVNMTHVIHSFVFGEEYPSMVNPLDGTTRVVRKASPDSEKAAPDDIGTYKYFLKVVPTDYLYLSGVHLQTNQFSVSEYFSKMLPGDGNLPSLYFLYDLSPITVSIKEERPNFFSFLTRLCAVLGGTFALTGFLDRCIYSLQMMTTTERSRAPRF